MKHLKKSTESNKSNKSTESNKSNKSNKSNESSSLPSLISSNNDYKRANYYNYYRVLEKKYKNEKSFRSKACLFNSKSTNSFKLERFDITSEMNDTSVISVWEQVYSNDSKHPVEAKYQIPLSPLSVISKFVVEYKDKVLVGKIKEISRAQEKYGDSIASGGQAFLGEMSNDGLFSFMIGNLPPNEKVTVKLTLVAEIGTYLDSLHFCLHRFMFPMCDFTFNFNLNISLSSKIKTIQLDHYKPTITYSSDGCRATVQFASNNGIKFNLITMVNPEISNKPQSLVEFNPIEKTYAVALNFYPVFINVKSDDINQKSEFIFLIDCSGSMQGSPIEHAKRALEICIRSLNEKCKFNIYCFGTDFHKVFEQSLLYNDDSLDKASTFIEKIDANLGGTEFLPPLIDILEKDFDQEYPRQVFILTDGFTNSREFLIDYVGQESNSTRLFTLGIGDFVDKELVIGLSKACMGYYEFIGDKGDMEDKVIKLLNVANEPTLANIKIDWGKLKVNQTQHSIRPVFSGERLMVYGILNGDPTSSSDTVVKMIGDGPSGEKLTFSIDLDFSKLSITSNQIHTLAAFKQIKDLERAERKHSKDHKDEIVELGKRYGLVSKYTSYIVTSDADGKITQESMESVDISSINIKKRNNRDRLLPLGSNKKSKCSVGQTNLSSPRFSSLHSLDSSYSLDPSLLPQPKSKSLLGENKSFNIKQSPASSSSSSNDPLISLLKLQKANGSFSKSSIAQFNIIMNKAPVELSTLELEGVWVTLLAVSKISSQFKSQKNQWERAINKSIKWIKQQLAIHGLLDSYDKFEVLSKSIKF